jgi:hypothetical protein
MLYQIVHVLPTDYEANEDREALQKLVDELNRDAIADATQDRWIVVQEAVVGNLFDTAN